MAAEILHLHAFLLIIHFTFSTSFDTITLNQPIKDGNLLLSEEKTFTLGFFTPGNSRYRYLGIWYYKIPKQTIVWVANRNSPINGSSGILSVNRDGNLKLYSNHDQQVPVWSTNVSVEVSSTCVAQLLDSGNLVLMEDASKRVLWQSFDYPTDTMLSGMKLGLDRKTGLRRFLTSWRSADDPGIGEYSLELNPTGSPQVFLYKGRKTIWRTIPWRTETYADVRNYTLVDNQDEISISHFIIDDSVILIIVLDYLGIHRHLTWYESEGKWNEIWLAPKYQCGTYGHCGSYSKCNPALVDRVFECDCLPGFEPKNTRVWNILRDGSGGCVRKRLKSYKRCTHGEGFLKVEHVKVPDTSVATWVNMSIKDCEQECRRDCSCNAYANIDIVGKGIGCLMWFGDLIDTVDNLDATSDLYVRVDAVELAASKKSSRFLGKRSMILIFVLSIASAWFVIILLAYILKRKREKVRDKWKRRFKEINGLTANKVGDSRSHLAIFSHRTILAATNNFSAANKLGQGGFGSVYKGQLANGQEIAVKRLEKNSRQGIEEFKNEVMLIAKLQHKNLVKLLGCCIEEEEPMLIYEYLSNKSLDLLLFDEMRRSILNWKNRFDIIIGIARGILYLHQDSRLRIIHRDLKTSNILLDEEMNPKISDFGIARIFEGKQIQEKTKKIIGTFGYMSPEYIIRGKFSIKSDVYSYGVILLEVIAGKKNNNFCPEDSSSSLIEYAWEMWIEDRALEIIDSSLKESYDSHEALRCIQIGLLCVQANEMDRPTMSNVLLMLSSEISLPSPKQSAFIVSKRFYNDCVREERSCSVNETTITTVVSR
ncbi:G-type lectin S-receptor-like serine/threonine-protein kinase RKS1 isoform X1 [Ricinus communis]|uniref:G-type lectin S-receptor-like serine/threonine-protein kinase RKS1 isoform X1 n=1 Tax=Ricinus communis TaxID=3988 RepID=UPI00201B2241|nr:G-type lectin S-receptor-like serine/threonine-protein kinase RKS1 isoform X1 [Ricinus communis]